MTRFIECPFCSTQQFIKELLPLEKINNKYLINQNCVKCNEKFIIPLNYKKVFLSRSIEVSNYRYKYPHYVKEYYSGILNFIDYNDYLNNNENKDFFKTLNKRLISESNIFVSFIDLLTEDLINEIKYAKEINIPIYIIDINRIYFRNEVLLNLTENKIYNNVDRFYQDLINKLIKKYNLYLNN